MNNSNDNVPIHANNLSRLLNFLKKTASTTHKTGVITINGKKYREHEHKNSCANFRETPKQKIAIKKQIKHNALSLFLNVKL